MSDQSPKFTLIHGGSTPIQLSVEQYDFASPLGLQTTVSDGLWTVSRTGEALELTSHGRTWRIAQPHVEYLPGHDPQEESPPVLIRGSQSLTVHQSQLTPDIPLTRFDLNGETIDGPSWLYLIVAKLAEETERLMKEEPRGA